MGWGQMKQTGQRLGWLDAAKGLGIILVVIGHVWTRGPVRDTIYAFHMPLFFLLAALAVVFTLASLAQKGRGIQDMLAGTWLVPR